MNTIWGFYVLFCVLNVPWAAHRKIEKERQFADEDGKEGDGREVKSYDNKKACAFTIHSILSCPQS